jgi:hypothetical protein
LHKQSRRFDQGSPFNINGHTLARNLRVDRHPFQFTIVR